MDKILVLNSGSSSLKYQLFNVDGEKYEVVAKGLAERIGIEGSFVSIKIGNGDKVIKEVALTSHQEAIKEVFDLLLQGPLTSMKELSGVGHRVVHGGEYFDRSVLVTDEVIDRIAELCTLAPLHNPAALLGIKAVKSLLPDVPQVVAFDTAFHQTMPDYAFRYAIPEEYYEQDHVRKYGMHGTSHKYVTQVAAKMLNKDKNEVNLITCHLGNGSSITAIKNGKVIDTSMGFTPLAGLVMGTRCGDIDPAVIVHILSKYPKMTSDELNNLLNKQSGVAAVSGIKGGDMREIEDAMLKGDKKAELAFNMLCYSAKKYLCAYYGILNGIDGIVFTAGIGENSPLTREKICEGLDNLGIKIDKSLNEPRSSKERFISSSNSKIKVMVIPTNEELMIARESIDVLNENK